METSQGWQRSPVGITPIIVHPRPGHKVIRKRDTVHCSDDRQEPSKIMTPNASLLTGVATSLGATDGESIKSSPAGRVCSVCTRAAATYSCPRCLIGYCSSKCYKAHGSRCTEAFFRGHVERETRIREAEDGENGQGAKERRAKMVELLRRSRGADSPPTCSFFEDGSAGAEAPGPRSGHSAGIVDGSRGEGESPGIGGARVGEETNGDGTIQGHRLEELARALQALSVGNEPGVAGSRDTKAAEDVMSILTDDERTRFLREVANGRLARLVVPWVPWWTKAAGIQELSAGDSPAVGADGDPDPDPDPDAAASEPPPAGLRSRSVVSSVHAGFDTEDACDRHSFSSLLASVQDAPNFSSLSARAPSPTLPALAVDLTYAYACVARLYNGCWCGDPVGASLDLVGASPVLRDAATPATVAEALASCIERQAEGSGGRNSRAYAESLTKDVLLLCEDPRKLTCAFQDAWALLEAAGRALAPVTSKARAPGKPRGSARNAGEKGRRKASKELGRVEKRLGYFLLWARSHSREVAPRMAADLSCALADRSMLGEAFVADGVEVSPPVRVATS